MAEIYFLNFCNVGSPACLSCDHPWALSYDSVKMSVLFYSILVSINLIPVILAKEHVPVLLWSPSLNIPSVPSLKHFGSVAFNELVHDAFGTSKPMIAVFLEENLSSEDFTLRTNNEESIYGELKDVIRGSGTYKTSIGCSALI